MQVGGVQGVQGQGGNPGAQGAQGAQGIPGGPPGPQGVPGPGVVDVPSVHGMTEWNGIPSLVQGVFTPVSGTLYVTKITAQNGGVVQNLWTTLAGNGTSFTAPVSQNVTNVTNNGSGLIRLTVASTAGYATNNVIVVQNVVGVPANGAWAVTVVGDGIHLDLQGSTFSGSYVTGGTVVQSGNCMGLYDSSGNILNASIDQGNIVGGAWQVGNRANASLFVNTSTLVVASSYYVALLVNVSGAAPTFRQFGTPFAGNANLTGSGLLWGVGPTGLIALPKTITLGSLTFATASSFWAAIGP